MFTLQKPHKSQNCHVVSDIRTRKSIVRTSTRCFKCLKGSHPAKVCSSKIKCFKCSIHHIALCDSEESSQSSNSSSVTNVAGVDDNNSARVLLFDSCSQLSYITPQLHNHLKLKTVST